MGVRIFLVCCLIAVSATFSQAQQVLDGAYVKQHNYTKQVIEQPNIREADVLWSKRIWRRIDVKQKMNHTLYYPLDEIRDRKSLFVVIKDALENGEITMFEDEDNDCEFTRPFPAEKVTEQFGYKSFKDEEDEMTGEINRVEVTSSFTPDMLRYIDVKEDWYFDKQTSEMRVKILGIALTFVYQDETGQDKRVLPGWFYFPELKYVLANFEVFNMSGNDSERRSFLDIFLKRQFTSYILKESNVYNRFIVDYKADGLGRLAESERIKDEMFRFEHDLWSY